MGNVLQLSLLAVAAAQLLHGAPRIIVLAVGLAGMFLPQLLLGLGLSLIHISEPTRLGMLSRMPSSA